MLLPSAFTHSNALDRTSRGAVIGTCWSMRHEQTLCFPLYDRIGGGEDSPPSSFQHLPTTSPSPARYQLYSDTSVPASVFPPKSDDIQ